MGWVTWPCSTPTSRATVAVVDVLDTKLDVAKRLGAAYSINATTEDPASAIQALGGADAAIVLAATPKAYEQAFASLRPNGTLVMVGLPADNTMHLPIFETVLRGITVVGSLVGTRVDLAETFQLHAEGRTTIVSETRRLEQVNDAIAQVEQRPSRGPTGIRPALRNPVAKTRDLDQRPRSPGGPGSSRRRVAGPNRCRVAGVPA